jgi:hypothetical protein
MSVAGELVYVNGGMRNISTLYAQADFAQALPYLVQPFHAQIVVRGEDTQLTLIMDYVEEIALAGLGPRHHDIKYTIWSPVI